MEKTAATILPGTVLFSGDSQENISEKSLTKESFTGVAGSLPTSLTKDCSSSVGIQMLACPLSSQLTSDKLVDGAEQEVHYGSQTDGKKSCTISQTNEISLPGGEGTGFGVKMVTKENQSVTLEYKPETAKNAKLDGKEHTSPQSQTVLAASPVQQSGVAFKDTGGCGAAELCNREKNSSGDETFVEATERMVGQQDTRPLASPSPRNVDIKETDISKTQPNFKDTSNHGGQTQKANSLEAGHVTELTSDERTQPPPPTDGKLENVEMGESLSGLEGDSVSAVDQASCGDGPPDGKQLQSCAREEEMEADLSAAVVSFHAPTEEEEHPSELPVSSSVYDGSLVVSLQAEQVVVPAEASHSPEQVLTAEALVHSVHAQEIVVVGEDGQLSGDWADVQLNQSYLLQREDGSVCEAAIVNQLAAATQTVQGELELHSQPVEVYEFCSLVEEVAEETVCGGQGSHSPEYEVNLFNALLEHSEDFKQELHLDPSLHAIGEGETVIITQQPLLPPEHDTATKTQAPPRPDGSLSLKGPRVAAVSQRLMLDANRTVQVAANSSEVCLVQVAAETPQAFTIQRAQDGLQLVTPRPQVVEEHKEVGEGSGAPQGEAAGVLSLLSAGEDGAIKMPVAVTVHVSHGQQHPSREVTIVGSAAPSPSFRSIPEALAATSQSAPCGINPSLLLKQGEIPHLKPPTLLPPQVSSQQSASGQLANAHSSQSSGGATECLPQRVAAADHTQHSVNQTPATSLPPTDKSAKEALINKPQPAGTSDFVSEDIVPLADAVPPVTPNSLPAFPPSAGSPSDPAGQQDSLYMEEEELEDMDQDEGLGDGDALEATSGQMSSPEEASDEDPDKTEAEMSTPARSHKWIGDRVATSQSTSLYSSPSPSSDWSARRRERSSPLRGPHGKFVSPSSVCSYASSNSSPLDQNTPHRLRGERHTDMAELAKHEADIEHRTQALKREGFWSMKRLTRLTEPQRPKVHWEYLCEEMQWLSADFAQERRWKRGVARKVVRMVMRHHEELRQKEEKAKRDEHAKIRRVASSIAKEVRAFWSSVEKVVQYKQQSRLEEKRKKALDLQLDFIVGQTEKYSDLLSKSLAPIRPAETVAPTPKAPLPAHVDEEDGDFEPTMEEEDDEETIEVEEQQEGNDAESHQREIELLKEEGLLPLDQLLSTLNLPQESVSEEECSDETSSSTGNEEEDGEFTANEEDAEDQEDTIAAQEKVEGDVNHAEELDDLAREGDMSVEELLEKYKGAYASDFEVASASGSKASSDSEESGDEEVETDEEESDAESNTSSSESPGDSGEDDDSDKDVEESEEEEEDDDDCGDDGMELLLKEGDSSPPSSSSRPKKEISHIAATAESLQPKGYTLATTKVKTPIPFLLHGTLREYQHIGLDWLVTMYEKKLNGILADEMGLGKTIQTIALLAHLACEKGNWGPHLIIVPTSVMLNWEMELKRWCPGFKILTYFGSQKERKLKRQGWTKPNAFHVCITSYKLVLQDHQAFRRKSWRYLILDEAQNIKNFKSQRWQSLLNFNSHRRLLLTGTPLQNSLMELWSLMHFLMPHVFQSHREFKEWFSNPLTGMIEGSQEYNEGLVKRLHKVLRPFLLRRIKVDVEKQMPKKFEHVVRCRLSKRQRFLYDDFMALASTRETLASGHFMSVINILMQLRKVCNHPNLFDPRPIQSPFITQPIVFRTASLVQDAIEVSPFKRCDLSMFNLVGLESCRSRYQADIFLPRYKVSRQLIEEIVECPEPPPRPKPVRMKVNRMFQPPPKGDNRPVLLMNKPTCTVPPAAQTPKAPAASELVTAPPPAPVVQQVVCSVTTAPPPRPPVHLTAQTAVRSSLPKTVLTVRPPTAIGTTSIPVNPSPNQSNSLPQRVLLSPDMQARLPSGEVVSIAQLASLAGRPVSSCQGSKPVTFQLQGNKLTLSGAPIHQVSAASARPVQSNVMHLVSTGSQHHLIASTATVAVQSAANASTALPAANRLPHNISQAPSLVSSPGVVKIVVRQATGKEGGPVPTLAVAPSPRVAPQAVPSPHPHANTTPVRTPASLQITHRTPGPATAHYTIAPPVGPSSTPNQPHPPHPVLKVVQPPQPLPVQPAPAQTVSSSSVSKTCAAPRDSGSSSHTRSDTKSGSTLGTKAHRPPRKVPPLPPRSPFHVSWLSDALKDQRDSRLDLIFRVNERRCSAKPMYGQEVLDFLTFLPGPSPRPAILSSLGEWGRSGHTSCLFSQWHNKCNLWFQSHVVKKAIHSIGDRLDMLSDVIDRFTFAIPPVEAPPISMHSCHPPPSLSQKEVDFTSTLTTQVTPLTRCLHRIQCNMRTQFPDLRLIQYDCGKLQTLHTLLRKLKTGGHRVLIFTQMTRMLDVLEQFLNYHGHIYLRLDGSTRVEQRQALMERFNADRRIFCFILSTRSGGVGVNLTGADTVVFYDSDWNPTMDAQAQDRCHRIGQTRDVHIYRLISERTVEENILKKANQKRMLGDMAIEGGNFTTAFFKQQTIRELFDMNDGEKREVAVELSVPQTEEEENVNKQSTTILEQALCRAEDEEDIVAASQAKAEQVAELAEFNESIPLDDGGDQEEVEELSKAEQEIAALVEQLTPIERYAMNFLEASLEDVCKEELKQAEEQVEAARKGLDQAKEEGLKIQASSDDEDDDFLSPPASTEPAQPTPARRGRKPKDKDKVVLSTRTSGRLRGASPETDPEPTPPREVPERLRFGLRGRGAAKDSGAGSATPSRSEHHKSTSSNRLNDSSKSSKTSSPVRDQQASKSRTLPNRPQSSPVPSPPSTSPPGGGKLQCAGEPDSKSGREEKEVAGDRRASDSAVEPTPLAEHKARDGDGGAKDSAAMSPPSISSRSPRKRQSADGEVLRGLVEDSPSAKVLRKLPGRLVTVVEEKEPRKRRRRGSGTGGGASSEEAAAEESAAALGEDTGKDQRGWPNPEGKPLGDQLDSSALLSAAPQPVRSYPPYSPPHLSPDMPVLRNLPVRRRLETESRMAAQLGEQQLPVGRGRGGSLVRKAETTPGREGAAASSESSVNSLVPVKRKRGRPPKTPPKLAESFKTATPPSQPTPPPTEERNLTLSPKRKRGRPRKESATAPETASNRPNSRQGLPTPAIPAISKLGVSKEPSVPSATPPTSTTSKPSNTSTVEEADRETEAPKAPLICTATTKPLVSLEEGPQLVTAPPGVAPPVAVQSQAPSAPCVSVPVVPSTGPSSTAPPLPATTTTAASPPSGEPTLAASSLSTVKTATPNTDEPNPTSKPAPTPPPVQVVSMSASPETVLPATVAVVQPPACDEDSPHVSSSSAVSVDLTEAPTAASSQLLASPAQSPAPVPTSAPVTTATGKTLPENASSDTTPSAGAVVSCTPASAAPLTAIVQSSSDGSGPSSSAEAPSSVTATEAQVASTQAVPTEVTVGNALSAPCTSNTTSPTPSSVTSDPDKVLSPGSAPAQGTASTPVEEGDPDSSATAEGPPLPTSAATAAAASISPAVATSSIPEVSDSVSPERHAATTPAPTAKTPCLTSTVSSAPASQTSSVSDLQVPPPPSSAPSQASAAEVQPAPPTPETPQVSTEPAQDAAEMEMNAEANANAEADANGGQTNEEDSSKPQPKRRRVESSSETNEPARQGGTGGEEQPSAGPEEVAAREAQQSAGEPDGPVQKRPLSRQSSQESARSSSPSSGCSTSTLTRHAHHKRTYENRHPPKKRRAGSPPEGGDESTKEEPGEGRRSRSSESSSSSESDREGRAGGRRLTRSAQRGQEAPTGSRGAGRPGRKRGRGSNNGNASTGGDSGSDTSSARTTRRSADRTPPPPPPPEPLVLGKRCSALNAAAKLLAMKGRVDTPGHTPRKEAGAKPPLVSPSSSSSSSADKAKTAKSVKSAAAPPQTNSTNSRSGKTSTSNQTSCSASRSTRQRPGSLVPPLEGEYKRSRGAEDKDRAGRKSAEAEQPQSQSSSRGHSACSSMSSDGEGGCGVGRSSRSSSNSSQRTAGSRGAGRRGSRAASSGSERSSERGKKGGRTETEVGRKGPGRQGRRARRFQQEAPGSSGTDGTPDRVLRSVAALAAVQARSPAASTRSSSTSAATSSSSSSSSSSQQQQQQQQQQRHNKT